MKWYDLHYRRTVWLVVFGATVGALLDYLHTDGGTIVYPEGTNHWRGIATFAVVYSIGGILFTLINRFWGNKQTPVPYEHSYPTVWIFCALYAFTAYLDHHTVTTFALLLGASLAMWYYQDRTLVGLAASIVSAFVGGAVESSLSHLGTMSYTSQDYAYLPVWLPAVYFASGTSWGQVCRRVLEIEEHASPLYCPKKKTKAFSETRNAYYYS